MYTNKYYPLLVSWANDTSTFEQNVKAHFTNADEVLAKFRGGTETSPTPIVPMEVKTASLQVGVGISENPDTSQHFYVDSPSRYKSMRNKFVRSMVESAIYNPETRGFIDANVTYQTDTYLNEKIIAYKKSLLKQIITHLDNFEITQNIDELSFEQLADLQTQVLAAYRNTIVSEITDHDVYDAFVILTNFDSLLKSHTPFISINKGYEKSNQYTPKRYIYNGPTVKHFTGVMSTNEFMSAEENSSELAKILLEYFPEIGENGPISGTSINISGFNSAMTKVFAWAKQNMKEELNKGVNADMGKIINAYITAIKNNTLPIHHKTYLLSKLNGIRTYIYGQLPIDIQQMFTHLVSKTVPSNYVEYKIEGNDVGSKYLSERSVTIQRMFIEECINSASEYWKDNISVFDEILNKYNIKISGTPSKYIIRIGDATITVDSSISVTGNINDLVPIVESVSQLAISEDTESIAQSIDKDLTTQSLYAPVIAAVILKTKASLDLRKLFGPLNDLGRVLSIMHGSEIINVVKNGEDNNLPLYQMLCLAYRHDDIYEYLKESINNPNNTDSSPYAYNFVYNNMETPNPFVLSPQIRSGIMSAQGRFISAASMTANDVMHIAILNDFYDNLITPKKINDYGKSRRGIVGFQSHVYSDKNKHFIQMFDLDMDLKYMVQMSDGTVKEKHINPYTILTEYLNSERDNLDHLIEAFWSCSKLQIDSIIYQIINDYSQVFGKTFSNLSEVKQEIKNYLSNNTLDDLRAKFYNLGIDFNEEIHISKVDGSYTINESIEYLAENFKDLESFKIFINDNYDLFKSDAKGTIESIEKEINNPNSRFKGVKINRLLRAYFIMDSFITNEYNRMMVGQVFAHPYKNKVSKSAVKAQLIKAKPYLGKQENAVELEQLADKQWKSESYASRWIGQVKRMVIYGATYHSYAQGLLYGVPEKIKAAVIEDLGSSVFSITGQNGIVDSMDGSGLTSPIFSRMQNTSLIDAAVGANKKTIYHDIQAKYGLPTLLKWAEYEITNEKRRNSHTVSLENIYRKMHNLKLSSSVNINISSIFDELGTNLYFTDQKGRYFKIESISIQNGQGVANCVEVDSSGNILFNEDGTIKAMLFNRQVTSIYDIDQLLGGAWAMTLDNGILDFTETNLDLLTKIVCENNLKGDMIGWLINKSGIKVGASNLNSKDRWTDDESFRYVELSTKFGGLQMNADHELDHAEVTEMTQMISALEQMGYSHDIATAVYREIGQVCHEAISKLYNIVNSNDPDKVEQLYQIYGKAVIEAFATGTKDTLGLAQAFCSIASRSLQDNKLTYRIPFSSASINGIFNSTVTSQLIKKAIRRHYSGVGAVLNPSFNMIEYYDIDGLKHRKEELGTVIKNKLDNSGLSELFEIYSIDDFINNHTLTSPFIEQVSSRDIDFEDTVILYDNENNIIDKIKIDTYEKYDFIKHHCPYNIARHNLAPKNLKGSNTTFTSNGVTHSMFESPYTIILKYFIHSKVSTDINTLTDEWRANIKKEYVKLFKFENSEAIEQILNFRLNILNSLIAEFESTKKINALKNINIFKRFILKKQQTLLNNLSENKPISWVDVNGNFITIPIENVTVHAAQIGMGKLFAQEFGLRKGDSIAKIKSQGAQFFQERIGANYEHDNGDVDSYDWVLYDGAGNKLFVKLGDIENVSANSDFWAIEGAVYHNGEELCSSEGKKFVRYTDSDGNTHDLCIVDHIDRLRELVNSKACHRISRNYTARNYTTLLEEEFGSDTTSYNLGNGIIIDKSQIDNVDVNSVIGKLAMRELNSFARQIKTAAEEKYQAFLQSLNFVGTRIPCQNMTSFAPVEVVIFSDVTENEIYLPTTITWLEGSDYDIDKTYLLGYSVSRNGTIHTESDAKPQYQTDALKNRVVSGIWSVITNPSNQINLTNPLTIEHVEEIAKNSILGQGAKKMTSYNPASRYLMQIENMVGKNVIGNVATAIKSFFALSNVYNSAFNNIYTSIIEGNESEALKLLNQYTFIYNGKRITLANVNVDKFYDILENIKNPEIRNIISAILYFQERLDDQSLMLGEILNCATDNAKELILKKINADTNWVDIYTSGVILGEDINNIGNFMTSQVINDLVSKYNTSAFDTEYVGTKIDFIRKAIASETDSNKIAAYNELLRRVYIAEELRIMGKILKINQGMPTNSLDLQQYIESIEQYVESRLNHVNLENYYELRREREKLLRDYNLTYEEYKNYKKAYKVLFELNKLYKESNPNENMYAYKFINILKDRIKNGGLDSEVIQQYEFIINQFSHLSYNEFNILYDNVQIISEAAKREFEAKQTLYNNWQYFNLLNFILNEDYANEMDARYEENKVVFNILNTLKNSPHFNEMFKVIGLNETILTILSKRNAIEKRVWNRAMHKYEDIGIKQAGLSKDEMSKLKQNIDDTLADTWIKTNIRNSDGSPVRIIWIANEKSNIVTFDGGFDYKLFIKYIETELIPRLRNNGLVVNGRTINTADNAFIKHLTFGKDRDGNTIFRLPYNMTQIDKNPGIQMEYEKILSAFGQLRGIILDSGLSIVDMFYLYNLIIHKDKINSRYSLTRLFEDLIASDGGEQLLVFKFNEWLETVNEKEIINKVLGNWGVVHSNDNIETSNIYNLIQSDDSNINISKDTVAEEPVTIGFGNTSDRISEEPNESDYIEPIRRLQLLDDYYRPIFTSEELISFEEDAKRIFDNKFILNERVNIHYSEWKILDDITDMRRWEKIWEDIVYDGDAEESENDFKYNNKSKTVQIPKYIYDRIKLYQKYQKLVDFLMGIAQKNNYYDYYGNLLRHDEDWFGDLGSTSLDILKDLYDLAGIKEIYDDPNQLKLFDSLHINSDYIADSTPVYQTTPSKQSKLIEVVRQANEKGIKGLHVVYQSDLIHEDIYIRSANGFVRNGEIYINVDRAGDDTVIHEFGHLYLADAKNNNRLAYYALLEKVKDTELWKRMRTWAAYANKVGSDFDEEILATMIGEYYKSGFENYEYESLVKEALELVDPAFIELLNSEILPDLGDTFITNYHFQQKVATWKSKLVSDNILKENCL